MPDEPEGVIRALSAELEEARRQQAATADILKVISRSRFDLPAVLDALVETAARLCDADMAGITRPREDGHQEHVAQWGGPPGSFEHMRTVHHRPWRGSLVGRVLLEGRVVQIPDALGDPEFAMLEAQRIMGFRTLLGVPLMREGVPIGVLNLWRSRVEPFSLKQIELLATFADQAVIAIENARLLEEVQARTRDLSEALEQQIATSEVLGVISRSPTQVQPVLHSIVNTAARLCSAEYSYIARHENGLLKFVAHVAVSDEHLRFLADPISVDRGAVIGRVALEKRPIHVPDVLADPEFDRLEWQRVGKQRTVLGVPLLREGALIGVIILARTTVAPFTEKQVELVSTFADQAVIAIENARLFDAIQEKSRQLEIANKHKSHFIASASHDLRQPLHALNLFVAQLQSEREPVERERLVGRIDAAVKSMNELFEALLDMTRLEAGTLEPNLAAIPVGRLLRRIETTFAEAARKKGLRLRLVPSSAWTRSDFILLERILLNLVSNAVRYTTHGGVVVGCRRRGERLRIDVCDSGSGIPEDQRQSIFTEYYQLAEVQPEHRGGLGLGLAIVDRLGRLLDHPVELDTRLGRGSRFSISVPLATERDAAGEAPATLAAPANPADGRLILVIDDDPLVIEGMSGILRSWGSEVVTAESEEAALASVVGQPRRPDLIISDYRLGGGRTGIETIEHVRSALGAAIPAFLISGDTAPDGLRAARAGGYHLLHKPVPPMRLRAMLSQLLKARPAPAAE